MAEKKLNINEPGEAEQNKSINRDNVYVNYTADYQSDTKKFIHNSVEILLIEQGSAKYEINGNFYTVEKNDILIIDAMNVHRSIIEKAPYIRYGIYFNPAFLKTIPMVLKNIEVFSTPTPSSFQNLKKLPDNLFSTFIYLARSLYKECNESHSDGQELIKPLLWEMSILLKRLLKDSAPSTVNTAAIQTMLAIRSFIDENYMNDCTLTKISKNFYINPTTISKDFKELFSMNFNQYLTLIRISNSIKLLEKTKDSITDIAMTVGYLNVNSYIRAFSKIMGSSPLQYRKHLRETQKSQMHTHLTLHV